VVTGVKLSGSFGTRVRELRQERGWSQARLGGDEYTASYISYLESGRRAPSPDAAAFLAERLGVDPVTLGFGESADVGSELDIVSYLVLADRALHTREWVTALEATERAEEMALATDRQDRVWEAQYLRCRILVEKSDFSEAAELVLPLCDGVVTSKSVTVRAEVLNLAARILRSVGRLNEAVEKAAEARRIAPDVPRRVEAILQWCASCAERGDLPTSMQGEIDELRDLAQYLPDGHLKGRIYWYVGNLQHFLGDTEGGERSHADAAVMIRGAADLVLWSRVQRVIAHFRMTRGDLDGVWEQLEVAENAMRLTGRASDLAELAVEQSRCLFLMGDTEAARDRLQETLMNEVFSIAYPSRAEAFELLGDVLLSLEDYSGARKAFRNAASDYEAIGAGPRALEAWRYAANVPER
jgi:transcriptional regulator with XRE-family HTH domain